PSDFAPTIVEVDRWRFFPGGFEFDGKPYRLEVSALLRLLKLLVTKGEPCDWKECLAALRWSKAGDNPVHRVHVGTHKLRKQLRLLFGLSDNVNPVPCMGGRGEGGCWTVHLPIPREK